MGPVKTSSPENEHQLHLTCYTLPKITTVRQVQRQTSNTSKMASMAFANYRRRSIQLKADNALLEEQKKTSFCSEQQQQQDFGAKQMTTFFEENQKNLTKKWSCDEDGVAMNGKWHPNVMVRTFSFSGAEYLSQGKIE